MALPKHVQRQAEQIAEFDARMAAEAAAPPAEGETVDPPIELEIMVDAAPVAPPVEPTRDDGQWEQRYRSLQGMFAREQQLRQQDQTNTQALTQQLAQLTRQVNEQRVPPAKPTALVTEKDNAAFGEDLVDMARRVAREEFGNREDQYQQKIIDLQAQVQQQVGEVKQTQQQSASDGFFSRLAGAVPAWEAMQATAECQQWLSMRVPGSDFTWNDVLLDAAGKFNAPRAVEVFQTFQASLPQPVAPVVPVSRKSELSRQVSPAKSPAALPTPTGEKRVYTSADYEAESIQVIRLTKAGKHDDAARIQADLDAALTEGRIKP